jgi:hypothetical protein
MAQQSVTKLMQIIALNLVTPRAEAKLEFFFNKPASEPSEVGLLNI